MRKHNRLKPTVTRQHLPDFGGYSLSSFLPATMPKETNEGNLQASHFLHDEHKIWCGKTNSSAHSKWSVNKLREFGGDKLAYRVPFSYEVNQGKNEGNRFKYLFSLKLSLARHDQRSCEQKCKHTFNEGLEKILLQLRKSMNGIGMNACVRAEVVCLCLGLSCCGGLAGDRRTRTRKWCSKLLTTP